MSWLLDQIGIFTGCQTERRQNDLCQINPYNYASPIFSSVDRQSHSINVCLVNLYRWTTESPSLRTKDEFSMGGFCLMNHPEVFFF